MARLNEPVVSTDSLETLRRKFLRQNRDIARHNSTQSLKIRALENECARLLSENLKLQSDVLRLKSELEGSHVHRVADHALQIKEKMEAQLVEWGTMLASLGHEPMPKNRSPRALKRPRIQRSSIGRSGMSDWRRRETMSSMQDLEAAALQEGRLPPLWENKTYPRETLNRDEILALCSEAEENADSPDLGPPPVSRFVDTDPVKLDLTTLTKLLTPALSESENSSPEDTHPKPTSNSNVPATAIKTEDVVEEEPKVCQTESTNKPAKCTTTLESQAAIQVAKANLKRKAREDEEKENTTVSKPPLLAGTTTKSQLEKAVSAKEKHMNRLIKELPSNKRDVREKSSHAPPRKPLGTKSSNEVLGSPKKSSRVAAVGKREKPKADSKDDGSAKENLKLIKQPAPIEIPTPSSPIPVTCADIEPESLSAEPDLAIPDSPEPSAPREEIKDTPPPVDISSNGETTRGNRRARAAVSYAEPNLRDKMRRPNTKQLFDAVAGEGKNIRRTSQCQKDEPASGPSSVAKSGGPPGSSRRDGLSRIGVLSDAYLDVDIMASPLVQKTNRTSALEDLPASVTTDRKRKDSMVTTQDHEANPATTKPVTKGANRRLDEIAAREVEVAKMFDEADVYEFTEASPQDSSKESTPEEKIKKTKHGRTRSRRLSSMAREDLQLDNTNQNEKAASKLGATRKRASMAAIKSMKNDFEDIRGGSPSTEDTSISSCSTAEGEGTTRETASNSRRRSMML
ncbi:hypothetical protein HD806DRAFT_484924 [Xylariaceae sp. AK1471]|nr:hypothetical protein HD806DRAFT_484924 [Xylariaceae sp. AK1471]